MSAKPLSKEYIPFSVGIRCNGKHFISLCKSLTSGKVRRRTSQHNSRVMAPAALEVAFQA